MQIKAGDGGIPLPLAFNKDTFTTRLIDALAETARETTRRQVTSSLSQNEFSIKLEKHLYDVSKGRGYLSSATADELIRRDIENGTSLAQRDPDASSRYLAFTTAFTYDKRARLVNSINGSLETLKTLDEVVKKQEKHKALSLPIREG